MNRPAQLLILIAALALIPSCATVDIKPIKVEPIHVVVDINLRVDRQLDQFFAFEDQFAPAEAPSAAPAVPATQPAAAAAPSTRPALSHAAPTPFPGDRP